MPPIKAGLFLGGTEAVKYDDPADSVMGDTASNRPDDSDGDDDVQGHPTSGHGAGKAHVPTAAIAVAAKIDHSKSDPRIKELKQQGYNDTYVSRQLKKEGFVNHAEKTVACRWRKIRTEAEQAENEELDDNLSDWHEGEDDLLQEAFNGAEKKFKQEVQKLEEAKWKTVSINLGVSMAKKKYTPKACKERYDGIQDGTAEVAFELDSDQDARTERRDKRIAENKRRRAQAKNAARLTAAAKQRKIDDEKERKVQSKLVLVNEKQQKMAEEIELKRIREEKRLGKEEERRARKEVEQRIKAEAAEQRRIRSLEAAVYRYYTGRDITRKLEFKSDKKAAAEQDEGTDTPTESEDEEASTGDTPTAAKSTKEKIQWRAHTAIDLGPAEVTKDTLTNPRTIMTLDELETLLFARGLSRRRQDEDHAEVVARLAAADSVLQTDQLNSLLAQHFAGQKGARKDRVARLQKADAANCTAGKEGVQVTDLEFREKYVGYQGTYAHLLNDE